MELFFKYVPNECCLHYISSVEGQSHGIHLLQNITHLNSKCTQLLPLLKWIKQVNIRCSKFKKNPLKIVIVNDKKLFR